MSMTPHRRFLYAIPLLCVLLFTLLLVSCGGDGGVTTPAVTDTGDTGGVTAPTTTTRVTRTTAPPADIERPAPTPDYFTVTFDPSNGQNHATVRVKNDRLPVTLPTATRPSRR